jgi:hypothetical protein
MTTTLPVERAHLHRTRARPPGRSNTRSYRRDDTGLETPIPNSIATAAIFASAIAPFWSVVRLVVNMAYAD